MVQRWTHSKREGWREREKKREMGEGERERERKKERVRGGEKEDRERMERRGGVAKEREGCSFSRITQGSVARSFKLTMS